MDNRLASIIDKLNKQNDILGLVRDEYLKLESTRKHYEAKLVKESQGKSHAEKLIIAQSSESWRELNEMISGVEGDYEFQKLKMDILSKEFQSEYLSLKMDAEQIKRNI